MDRQTELQECRREINELQHRINLLADKVNQLSIAEEQNIPYPQQTACVTPPTQSEWNINPPQQSWVTQPQYPQRPVMPSKQKIVMQSPKPNAIEQTSRTHNMEGNIGKNLFAIIASVLILIGVGIFISTIYEYIPEFVKIIAIYIFGIAMVGLGIGVYFKNKNNFWLGLASCGTAELLVSIIASYTYFEVISLPVTFALILTWVIGTFMLTKVKPALFKVMGYIGFIISILLGLSLLELHEGEMFIFLFISYVAVNFFFALTHKNLPVLNVVFMYIGTLLLALFYSCDYYIGSPAIGNDWAAYTQQSAAINLHIFCILAIIGFNVIHLFKYKYYKASYAIYSGLSAVLTLCYMGDLKMNILYPIMMIVFTGLWLLNIIKCGPNRKVLLYELIAIPTMLLLTLFAIFSEDAFFLISIIMPVIMLTLIYIKTHDYGSAAMALLSFMFIFAAELPDLLLCLISFIFAWSLYISTRNEQKLGLAVKNGWYLWGIYSILAIFGFIADTLTKGITVWQVASLIENSCLAIAFCVVTAINLFRTMKTAFNNNTGFNRNAESVFLYILNGIILCVGLTLLGPNEMEFIPTIMVIFANLAILSITLLQSLRTNWQSQSLTMIHCIKYTFYFWFLMLTFETEMIFINIVMLLFAIGSIVLGFNKKSKPARIYGLVLSLISSVSLVFFSVSFDSTLQVAGGIILCGLLCFGISFIYSKASKALEQNNKK